MNQLIFFAYSLPPALFIFYCFGGIKAISPHYERYAMFLIAPSTILLAILINNTFIRSYLKGLSLTVIIAWLFLFSFQTHYFKSIKRTSGLSHRTFRTAEIEPKKQAFASIIKDAKGEKNIVIIVEDWWLYWPITYLAKNHHNVSVYGYWGKPFPYLYSQITRVAKYNDKKMQLFLDKGYYIVGFTGGFLEKKLKKFDNLNKLHKWYIQDYSKRKLLFVCRKKTKNFSKAASPTLPENRPPS